MNDNLQITLTTSTGETYSFPLPVPDESIIAAYELRYDDQPIVRSVFAHHEIGYHTICSLWDDSIQQMEVF